MLDSEKLFVAAAISLKLKTGNSVFLSACSLKELASPRLSLFHIILLPWLAVRTMGTVSSVSWDERT
jgi:hypothetical protein